MGNIAGGGLCCPQEDEEFEPFHGTGGVVRLLIVVLNYHYSPGNELTAISDGIRMERMARWAEVEDITIMKDDRTVHPADPLFPTARNVCMMIQEVGNRCRPGDYFIFFYAGHGENVPDAPPYDEDDGFDEAFCTPGPQYQLEDRWFLIDDVFAMALERSIRPYCRILVLSDCCHSATICDIDSRNWRSHSLCSISACQDSEESADTGKGGYLTIALDRAVDELSILPGRSEYSIGTLYKAAGKYGRNISKYQRMSMSWANLDPDLTPWPLPRPFWKRLEG